MFSDPVAQLLLILFVVGLALTALLLRRAAARNPLRERLSSKASDAAGPDIPAHAGNMAGNATGITRQRPPMQIMLRAIAALGNPLAGGQADRVQLERLLATAGFRRPEATGLLMAAKYGVGLLLTALALWGFVAPADRIGLTGFAVGLMALFAGTTLPELALKARAAVRHELLARSMPDALDLMVICAEAGLPFPRILKVVSRELLLSAPAMADELAYTSAELQLLPDRGQALRHLAERTRVPTIESMVGSLIQAERYGTPLSQALRTIADESRTSLILHLEEKAGKLPAQMSVPLMTLILPPVVALVATPALMRVLRSLTT